eukprot:m.273371 g.273371  ORF g.273371 m.273371 type:complete len:86 (+) comp26885_c0_seq2:1134-1391(+)
MSHLPTLRDPRTLLPPTHANAGGIDTRRGRVGGIFDGADSCPQITGQKLSPRPNFSIPIPANPGWPATHTGWSIYIKHVIKRLER